MKPPKTTRLEDMKPQAIDAMESLFSFCKAMDDGQLSIGDLRDVMSVAVGEGHDMMVISLHMAAFAVEMAKSDKQGAKK